MASFDLHPSSARRLFGSLMTVVCLVCLACLAFLSALPAFAQATPTDRSLVNVETKTMPLVNNQALLAEDVLNAGPGIPLRFAQALPVSMKPDNDGNWETLEDGSWLWRLRISSPGALHLNFGFTKYHMPTGGQMLIYPVRADYVVGPYGAQNNKAHGQLWTPLVPGDDVVLEVRVPAHLKKALELELSFVNHGYRHMGEDPDKSGSCNVDVVCSEGDGWREQIRSVAAISINGDRFCTGFMVNNTSNDLTPLFMTANHCDTHRFPESLVFYWNYVNPSCRPAGSGESGTPFNGNLNQNTNGSTLLANSTNADYALLRLDDTPPESFNVFWAGWDARNVNASSSVAIHHPRGHAKRISFENQATTITSYLSDSGPGDGTHLRVADWDVGTTEGGSSGSPLFNQQGRVVGQLHGGFAACGNNDPDWYGRLNTSFPSLKNWLDPGNTGALILDGIDQDTGGGGGGGGGTDECDETVTPAPCDGDANTICMLDDRFSVQVDFRTFDDPTLQRALAVTEVTSSDSGLFYFFDENNWEFLVKMVDGCTFNDSFWVFAAATTNLEYTLRVTDSENGCVKNYFNPLGQSAPAITDTAAFATCP